jgi:hypothetical protein
MRVIYAPHVSKPDRILEASNGRDWSVATSATRNFDALLRVDDSVHRDISPAAARRGPASQGPIDSYR